MTSTLVKVSTALTLGLFLAASAPALAVDAENSGSSTVDTSHNPLTGTTTTTKKKKHHVHGAHGKKEMTTTETTKEKSDGSTSTEVKKDATTETKP